MDNIKYVNHLGEELAFGANGLYINASELHDFSWDVLSVHDKISGFDRGIQTKSIPVRVLCTSAENGIARKNALFEIPEKDVLTNQHGTLYVNGYACDCFITESKKERYTVVDWYMEVTLTMVTDRPYWYLETVNEVAIDPEWEPEIAGIDFPFGFDFGFGAIRYRETSLMNESFFDTKFRLVIHGKASNPSVFINGHEYSVDVDISEGDSLIIDSVTQKVYIEREGGQQENAFDQRNRESYIFQSLPSGELTVMWSNTFSFDLVLVEQRSEPRWS